MIDLYTSSTPNGRKISIMLEELEIDYNPILISLDKKEQFSPDNGAKSYTNCTSVNDTFRFRRIIVLFTNE